MGRLWARFMPRVNILGVSLNPGPFTIKEHVGTNSLLLGVFSASTQVLVTIMAGVGSESAYAVSGITWRRNLTELMVDLCRPISLRSSGCCINKPGVSRVREERIWPHCLVLIVPRPVVTCHLNSANRVIDWRNRATTTGRTTIHE